MTNTGSIITTSTEIKDGRSSGKGTLKAFEKKRRKLSNIAWIRTLHQVGIRHVQIVYREHDDGVDAEPGRPYDNVLLSPTLVVCEMDVSKPMAVQTTSAPMATKALARDLAISQLVSILQEQDGEHRLEEPSPAKCEDELVVLEELEKLLLCDSPYIHYQITLPRWACWNVAATNDKEEMLLYELVFSSCRHQYAASTAIFERLDLAPDQVTRVGLLLPVCSELVMDDLETLLEFEAPFQFSQKDDMCWVQLKNPQRICLPHCHSPGDSEMSSEQQLLRDFYLICTDWKTYGAGRPLKALRKEDTAGRTNTLHTRTRRYTFVPLLPRSSSSKPEINWRLVEKVVANETVTYLVATRRYDIHLFGFTALILSGKALYDQNLLPDWLSEHFMAAISAQDSLAVATFLLGASFVAAMTMWLLPFFHYETKRHALSNHFLHYRAEKNGVFAAAEFPFCRLNARAPVLNPEARAKFQKNKEQKDDVDLSKASFADVLESRHKIRLKHTKLNMIAVNKVVKMSDFNGLERGRTLAKSSQRRKLLAQELIHILPLPRDFLSIVGLAEKFMIPLETAICNHSKAHVLKRRASQIGSKALDLIERPVSLERQRSAAGQDICSLVGLLTNATTVFPASHFEQLEFLGDRVLNHFLSLNLLARNSELQWDHDQLRHHHGNSKKNKALQDGALRAGLNKLIHAGVIPWKEGQAEVVVPDAFLSNVAESILGAIYLNELDDSAGETTGQMVVGIMERLHNPMPKDKCSGDEYLWFRGRSVCLENGFDFEKNSHWKKRLEEASKALENVPAVKAALEAKSQQLLSILLSDVADIETKGILKRLREWDSTILLSIALFDANLDGSDENLRDRHTCEMLEVLGLIRDNLFFAGSTALELELSSDFFLINPNATPSDLHLLNACALTHDVLVYIMLKWGIHHCLFDESPSGSQKVLRTVDAAEALGKRWWRRHDGWILPGGAKTYLERRINLLPLVRSSSGPPDANNKPRYPGVVGGRLFGNFEKLDMDLMDDWQFSFKCIVGCFVLCLGSKTTWRKLIRPMLEELMLILPDEYRGRFSDLSSICKSYKKGKVTCL